MAESLYKSNLTILTEDFRTMKNLVAAGILLWATLTPSGRGAVKKAYHSLQMKQAVLTPSVQSKLEDEIPYTGKELEDFIQGQIEHREKVDKEIGPVSKKIFQSRAFFKTP
jgi:hypothetical protein